MTVLPLSDAKARLSELADEVFRTHERINVTRNGREYVVLIAAEELESLEATIELLADQSAVHRVTQALADIESGDFATLDELKEIMEARRTHGE